MPAARSDKWIECGRVGRPWGVRGAFLVDWFAGSCPVDDGGTVFIERGGKFEPLRIVRSRPHGGRHVVHAEGCASCDDAKKLRGAAFFVPADKLPPLSPGEYYRYQILGLEVYTEGGAHVGVITDIQATGANDVYEVSGTRDGKEWQVYIPAVDHVIRAVNIDEGRMIIRPLEGLLD